ILSFPESAETVAESVAGVARRFGLRCETIVDVMNGDVLARISDLDMRALGAKLEAVDEALHANQPGAVVIAGEHPHRQYLRVWGNAPDSIERMRALKLRFDPNRILNPGRFVGGI
ncbi:MAG: FAD-linked oxidase C-terminal domain-containing protein, partial [Candidatus Tumulicola sp.]